MAVTVAVPSPTPVTIPEVDTGATAGSEELQVTDAVMGSPFWSRTSAVNWTLFPISMIDDEGVRTTEVG